MDFRDYTTFALFKRYENEIKNENTDRNMLRIIRNELYDRFYTTVSLLGSKHHAVKPMYLYRCLITGDFHE